MNIHKKVLKEGLKGKGPCPSVKAGDRRYYQWQDTKDVSSDPLSDTIALIKWSDNNIIINHLCEEVGGYFISSKAVVDNSKCLHSHIAKLFKEMVDVVSVVTESADDKIITLDETKRIKKEIQEFVEAAEQFVEKGEKGYWRG